MSNRAIVIRKARPEDAYILAKAEREIAMTPGRLASHPNELIDENFKEKIVAISNLDSGLYVVLEQNGVIVGHALLDPHKLASTSHVVSLTIAVHEGHQGKGFGKKLMQYLINWTRSHPQIEKFELQVRSSNAPAINLYKSLGFVEEGRKTKRLKYGPNEYLDDVYMALWVK